MKVNPKGMKRHDSLLREKYGIGLHQYESLFESQSGACYLCGTKQFKNLAVDHNHTTGKVRRLLCSPCNQALGLFKDNPEVMRKAADYVESDFELPEDKECSTIPHSERARWRNIVTTPDGVFSSFEEAGRYYGVHSTTVGYWCGAYSTKMHLRKDGYEYRRVFE